MSQPDGRFVEQARRDLTALLANHPELEEDDVLRLDMVDGCTNAMELIDQLLEAERESVGLENGLDQIIERFYARRSRIASRRGALRKYMMQLMEAANLKKAERPAGTISIATGRPKVVITDVNQLPDGLVRIKREPDKELILSDLKQGRLIPGATLSNAEPVLRIS